MLTILACLVGVVLGLTFNVLILLPATVAGTIAYLVFWPEQGIGIGATIVVLAIALQAGYMIGLTGRETVAQLRAKLSIAQWKRT